MTNPLGTLSAPLPNLAAADASAEVRDLEARIRDGEDISPRALAEARERIRIAELQREGRRDRERAAAAAESEQRIAAVKTNARDAMSPHVARVESARAVLRSALRDLADAVIAHDRAIVDTGEKLIDAGLHALDRGLPLSERWDGVDRSWHGVFEAGVYDSPTAVVIDGAAYHKLVAGNVMLEELRSGLEAIGDPDPGNGERSALRRLRSL